MCIRDRSRTVSKLLQIIGQICAFEAPFGGLGATYAVHLRLIGKLVGDFLLVARCFRFVTIHTFDRQTDGRTDRISTAIPCVCFAVAR